MTPWRGHAVVFGEAQSMGSKRAFVPKSGPQAGRPVIVDDSPSALRSWQRELKASMKECAPPEPLDLAIAVEVLVHLVRPLAQYRYSKAGRTLREDAPRVPPAGRDIDKVLRAALDAGTGIWWRDDKRVASAAIRRLYTESAPRTEIEAWVADAPLPEAPGQIRLELAEVG